MRVQCSTCLELLTPSDDLTCTPCGHVFHMACVVQWFENKKNCPQVSFIIKKLQTLSVMFTVYCLVSSTGQTEHAEEDLPGRD